jgi:hypothetical protein
VLMAEASGVAVVGNSEAPAAVDVAFVVSVTASVAVTGGDPSVLEVAATSVVDVTVSVEIWRVPITTPVDVAC